ncbi:hypothetical protein COW09_01405 [bacterium (Candidatus Moisslbacteria) CG12_big_fil_rev_8_21_14_0_65_36_11]|nr:segregation/condensation protein A [Candidatus Kuenenbacteria bacterium]OIP77171.1 MAG: hypothetical protein AUK09_00340 [Parcubacteria group bacterium CG2_30_36_38]PIV46252.1 MAG: hypothetical protein COS23_00090 [bacterium (Candidatus Moisslbacteria) CG02_land_8_20_14_3_00_36_53]PIW67849.1 MAG: hypothetical protein COW09_01405 [bacterium (Candidatus Moisslbacteria) CG12_big_fil_rev_8_21_14_0_65_36_11]PIZ90300.1 MAG: hypothetical protein COX87_01280 [bacterium (Candidatus Moisslbacteria) CG
MYQIKISKFEGPLDLLLKLIEKEQLDITEISLANITGEFLGYLEKQNEIDPHELIDFLEVMVRLLLLKSYLLVPQAEVEKDDLVDRLKIYRHYWLISKEIWKIFSDSKFGFVREKIHYHLLRSSYKIKIDSKSLERAFKNFLVRLPIPEEKIILRKRNISLKEKIAELINLLNEHPEINLNAIFVSKGRTERVFIFLAVLDLLKERKVLVRQDKLFGQIILQKYVE